MYVSKIALSLLTIASLVLPIAANASMDSDIKDQAYVNLGNVKNGSSVSYREDAQGNLLSTNTSQMHVWQWVSFGNNRGVFRLTGTDIALTPTGKTLGLSLYTPNKGQVFSMKPTPKMNGMYNVVSDANTMICTANSVHNTVLEMRPYQPGVTIPECEFGVGSHQRPQVVNTPAPAAVQMVKPAKPEVKHNHNRSNMNKTTGKYNCDK